MIRYTTPTITLSIDTVLPEAEVYVTFQQGTKKLTKTDAEITRNAKTTTLVVSLTQSESASFKAGEPVMVQANWITADGTRNATKAASVTTIDNLLDEVISYG